VLAPRVSPVVVTLDESDIVILGGNGENSHKLSDIVVFNAEKKTCRKVSGGGDFGFSSINSQTALVGDKVVALVCMSGGPSLIKWTLGQDRVTLLKTYPCNKSAIKQSS